MLSAEGTFKVKETNGLEVTGWKQIHHAINNHRKLAVLVSEKTEIYRRNKTLLETKMWKFYNDTSINVLRMYKSYKRMSNKQLQTT